MLLLCNQNRIFLSLPSVVDLFSHANTMSPFHLFSHLPKQLVFVKWKHNQKPVDIWVFWVPVSVPSEQKYWLVFMHLPNNLANCCLVGLFIAHRADCKHARGRVSLSKKHHRRYYCIFWLCSAHFQRMHLIAWVCCLQDFYLAGNTVNFRNACA